MNTLPNIIILSAERVGHTAYENMQRTDMLRSMLLDCGFAFNSIKGFYKGVEEKSFVVIVKDAADFETVKDFAFKTFQQESILHSDANRFTKLIYGNGSEEVLGKFTQVPESVALKQESYTYSEQTSEYFICLDFKAAM